MSSSFHLEVDYFVFNPLIPQQFANFLITHHAFYAFMVTFDVGKTSAEQVRSRHCLGHNTYNLSLPFSLS